MHLVILVNEGGRDFLPKDLPKNGISSFRSHLVRDAPAIYPVSFPYSVLLACSLGTRPSIDALKI